MYDWVDITVPDSKRGVWSVETFTVTDEQARLNNLRAALSFSTRTIAPGTYKRLRRNGSVVMSNTPAEIDDLWDFYCAVRNASTVLINGLGLGVALKLALSVPTVTSVTVIEIDPDVIALVGPTYMQDPRVRIIEADALTYKPPRRTVYDVVWHDIWDDITSDNLPTMHKLHRKYGRRARWQGSWCRDRCETLK